LKLNAPRVFCRGVVRQASQLAEGQKGEDVKNFLSLVTPSARQLQLAEGVEFPERYADFCLFGCHLAEGGVSRRTFSREVSILTML
jgi:hypothetical protein